MINYEEMWTMLSKYELEIDQKFQGFVTCTICNNLLVDAFHGPCLCSYCKKCIERVLDGGERFCPGQSSECKREELSMEINVKRDTTTNRNISLLNVRCPFDSCKIYCKIADMSNHLRVCNKREMPCPFSEMGCVKVAIQNNEMEEHLMKDIYSHTRLMVEWLMNSKNDFTSALVKLYNEASKSDQETPRSSSSNICNEENNEQIDLDCLKGNIKEIEQKIKEMKNMKTEKYKIHEGLLNELKEKNVILSKEINRLNELVRDLTNDISLLKNNNNHYYNLEKDDNSNNWYNTLEVTSLTKNSSKDKLLKFEDGQSNKESSLKRGGSVRRMEKKPYSFMFPNEKTEHTGSLSWEVTDIGRLKKMNKPMRSNCFYTQTGYQKLWLKLYPGGCIHHEETHMCIQINIADSSSDYQTIWPLNARVSLTITNKGNPKIFKYQKLDCRLDPNNLELFHFSYLSLVQGGIMQSNVVLIDCEIITD